MYVGSAAKLVKPAMSCSTCAHARPRSEEHPQWISVLTKVRLQTIKVPFQTKRFLSKQKGSLPSKSWRGRRPWSPSHSETIIEDIHSTRSAETTRIICVPSFHNLGGLLWRHLAECQHS